VPLVNEADAIGAGTCPGTHAADALMTGGDVLHQDVKDFVREWILTPVHLDVLIFLHAEPERAATVAEIAEAQHGNSGAVEAAVAHFDLARLLERVPKGSLVAYRYAPENAGLRAAVERVVDAYNRIPVQLLRAVYDRPPAPVRSFSDAFRLHKPK
jgi:hypothetical protein